MAGRDDDDRPVMYDGYRWRGHGVWAVSRTSGDSGASGAARSCRRALQQACRPEDHEPLFGRRFVQHQGHVPVTPDVLGHRGTRPGLDADLAIPVPVGIAVRERPGLVPIDDQQQMGTVGQRGDGPRIECRRPHSGCGCHAGGRRRDPRDRRLSGGAVVRCRGFGGVDSVHGIREAGHAVCHHAHSDTR